MEPAAHPQIDIVAKDEGRRAGIAFAGSVKWHEASPFSLREYADLARDVHSVSGVTDDTTLLAVTRTGEKASEVPIRCLSAEDLLVARSSPAG